jgi:hypothetical protein
MFIMLFLSAVYIDNPQLVFTDQLSAEYTNPFEENGSIDGNRSNYSEYFEKFEGFVVIGSATEVKSHKLHLFALPDQQANVYRDIKIYIFSNQPCYYEVKIDDQVHSRGFNEWKSTVKATSDYSRMDVEVTLVNETNVTLPAFTFDNLHLLDSPWEKEGGGEEEEETSVDEWIRMSRGEFNIFIATRIIVDVVFVFLGVVVGTSMAAMAADAMGIQRII